MGNLRSHSLIITTGRKSAALLPLRATGMALSMTRAQTQKAGALATTAARRRISHLAAAVGIPCLLLFGPTDPAIWAPANEKVEVLRSKTGRMSDIAYRDVFKRVSRLLSCL